MTGDIAVGLFHPASAVASARTFDAAAAGILDRDMTKGDRQTGENPAVRFVTGTMGGYDTPLQHLARIEHEGWEAGHRGAPPRRRTDPHRGRESLNSTMPLTGPEDLQN